MFKKNICSVCQEEKQSYFRKITEAAKSKAEKGRYYNLEVNNSTCSRRYNEKIQYDRNEQYRKDKNRLFKRQKSTGKLKILPQLKKGT